MKSDKAKSVGRPGFAVDPARLKEMRKAAGLTQQALAERVYQKLSKPKASANVMKRSYQRWERSGAMPLETAKYLADELGATVGVLQGDQPDAPANAVDQIEARIRALAAGDMPLLEAALRRFADAENPMRDLALDITSRLEVAQLSQDKTELSKLSELTGWTLNELQRPAGAHGFWLLIRTGWPGAHTSELLHGVSQLLWEVRQDLEQALGIVESDARVFFHDEAPWFRVEVLHPRIKERARTLRFVRAQPSESGLRWTKPAGLDRFWIDQLPRDAFEFANFVKGFSDEHEVPGDLTRLRFKITRNPIRKEVEGVGAELRPEAVALAKLESDAPPAHVRATFELDGCAHGLVTDWLSAELWELLAPLLTDWPLEYWRLSPASGRIDVSLDAPLHLILARGATPRWGPMFSIALVEQALGGELRSVPWRRSSIAEVQGRLQTLLDGASDRVDSGPPRPSTL